METKKQEAIRLAYGEYWEKYKNDVDENGFIYFSKYEETFLSDDVGEVEDTFDYESERAGERPISLRGLSDNNGWISIESEEDLKLERGYYWFKWNSADGEENIQIAIVDNRGINLYQEPTHYQPIQKPNPPIF